MANFFKARREELDLTQRDIALKLNMTTSAVGTWENEVACPRLQLAPDLAKVYQVSEERVTAEIVALNKIITERRKAEAVG